MKQKSAAQIATQFLTGNPFFVGLSIRLLIAWLLPLLLDNGYLIPGVAYTDIDYHVFNDAAQYISQGQSPYQRHTYRYTPFLALILSKVNGRLLFCAADALCGLLILQLQKKRSSKLPTTNTTDRPSLSTCFLWMYNPLAINICTRGSAESFVVLLPVLLTVAVTANSGQNNPRRAALLAGVLHGIAVHAKLYPIIYSLTFMAYFGRLEESSNVPHKMRKMKSLSDFVTTWFWRLLQPAPLIFAIVFLSTFLATTAAGFSLYGMEAIQEGLVYHLGRVDHRHNYSMWWYPIYLSRLKAPGMLLMLPQAVLLVMSSLGIQDLGFALFVQTYLFVILNKVITAQYFTWYLCLLPLCIDSIPWSRALRNGLVGVVVSILTWLGSAYCLEMQGLPVYRLVWVASMFYFWANVNLLRVILATANITVEVPVAHAKVERGIKTE